MTRRVFNWKRWEIYAVLVVVVLVVGTFVVEPFWMEFKLRREVNRFGTPAGMRLVDKTTAGDRLCMISCDSLRTTVVFRSGKPADEDCRVLRQHMRSRGYEFLPPDPAFWIPPSDAHCALRSPARRIRSRATVKAVVMAAGGLGSGYVAGGSSAVGLEDDELVTVVVVDTERR